MLAHADSLAIPGPSAAAPAAFPPGRGPSTRRKATPKPRFWPVRRFPASTRLSARTRPGPAFSAGAWRSGPPPPALRAGRAEDEAGLRDAFHLSRPGADPTRGTASPRLAGALRPLDRTLAAIVRRRRRGPEGPARRGLARGDRRRPRVRRRQSTGAVRRGASLCPRVACPEGGGRWAAGEGRGSCSRRGSPTGCWRSG